jgi:hypothetical protein
MSLLDFSCGPGSSVTIYGPPVLVTDGSNAKRPTWPTVRAANCPCLIIAGSATERDEFSQDERQVATHTISFGIYDYGIQPGDKLVDDNTGKTYRYDGGRVPQQGFGNIPSFNTITVREVIV